MRAMPPAVFYGALHPYSLVYRWPTSVIVLRIWLYLRGNTLILGFLNQSCIRENTKSKTGQND